MPSACAPVEGPSVRFCSMGHRIKVVLVDEVVQVHPEFEQEGMRQMHKNTNKGANGGGCVHFKVQTTSH